MTLRVNSAFAAILAAATGSNVAWSAAFKNGLGASRRVICKRHANASTPEATVFTTGTTFRNAALTGEMTVVGGIITAYGFTSNLTTALAADLSTGISVLRIEGNGNWIEGTVGLVGSQCDFTFPVNPTTTNSIAVSPNMRISPPPFLPSGTGYAPPALDTDAPAYVIIENWSNPAAVVEAGRIYFNNRIANWVFQDAEYAANIGDVRVTQSTQSVTLGDIEFGAMLLSTDPLVGSIADKVLHQVAINFKPTPANWPNYPKQTGATGGGYVRGTRTLDSTSLSYGISNTFMQPFKAKICRADGTVLATLDMPKDNLPINSPELSEVYTKTKAIRPHMHCASMLTWNSHEPKLNTFRSKYFPGVDSAFLRPSLMKERSAINSCYPMHNVSQADSLGHWYGVAKWALPCSLEAIAADELVRTDPYLWTLGPSGNPANNPWSTPSFGATYYGVAAEDMGSVTLASALMMGWGYEPGSWSMHDQYSGPGGRRVDRAVIPTPIAIHMTDSNWLHLRDSTPIATMVSEWNKAYFNHAVHHFMDVKTFASVPKSEVLAGTWSYGNVYYNGLDTLGTLDHTIPLFAIGGSPTAFANRPHYGAFTDTNYRMPWNGYSNDWFHNYTSPGWAALLYNSPLHALSSKMRYFGSIMAQGANTHASDVWKCFLVRNQAWIFFQDAMMWKLASDHPLGVSRAEMETRIAESLMSLYTNIYVPLVDQNSQTMFFRGIRNLGLNLAYTQAYLGGCWFANSFSLHYYMAHALQFWRQTGLWKVMRDRSPQIEKVLLMLVAALDKGCIDYYLDTDGAYSGGVYNEGINLWVGDRTDTSETVELATSWADWQSRVTPKAGPLEDLVHTSDGTVRAVDVGEFSRMQWPFIRRDYFPDIPSSRDVAACCAKVTAWQNVWNAKIAALESGGTAKRSIGITDWPTHPAIGRILPPTQLEP